MVKKTISKSPKGFPLATTQISQIYKVLGVFLGNFMRIKNYSIIYEKRKGNFNYKWLKNAEKLQKNIENAREKLNSLETIHEKICFLYKQANRRSYYYKYYKMLRNYILPKPEGLCEICKTEKAYCKHHIIPLCKGGNNRDENLIDVCLNCHNAIHPFMHGSKEFDYPNTYRAELEAQKMDENFSKTIL